MLTYIILNVVFMLAVLIALRRYIIFNTKQWWLTLLALLVMTLVFDNIMISAGFVGYNVEKLLGIYAYVAPIEDFFYAVLAVVMVPALWNVFARPDATRKGDK